MLITLQFNTRKKTIYALKGVNRGHQGQDGESNAAQICRLTEVCRYITCCACFCGFMVIFNFDNFYWIFYLFHKLKTNKLFQKYK